MEKQTLKEPVQKINVYAEMFEFFKKIYIETNQIPVTDVSKFVFQKYYYLAVKAGVPRLEDLTQVEKDNLVKVAGQSRIRCKILYLIQNL